MALRYLYLCEDCVYKAQKASLNVPSKMQRQEMLYSLNTGVESRMRKRIEYHRLQRRWTMDHLSLLVHISPAHLHAYERGTMFPSSHHINRLQDVLETQLVP